MYCKRSGVHTLQCCIAQGARKDTELACCQELEIVLWLWLSVLTLTYNMKLIIHVCDKFIEWTKRKVWKSWKCFLRNCALIQLLNNILIVLKQCYIYCINGRTFYHCCCGFTRLNLPYFCIIRRKLCLLYYREGERTGKKYSVSHKLLFH